MRKLSKKEGSPGRDHSMWPWLDHHLKKLQPAFLSILSVHSGRPNVHPCLFFQPLHSESVSVEQHLDLMKIDKSI